MSKKKKRRGSKVGEWEFQNHAEWYPLLPSESNQIEDLVSEGVFPRTFQIKNTYGEYSIDLTSENTATQTNISTGTVRSLRFHSLQDMSDKKAWDCPLCTFKNISSVETCKICLTGTRPESEKEDEEVSTKRNPWAYDKCVHVAWCLLKHKETNRRDCYYVKSILMRLLLFVPEAMRVDLPFRGKVTDVDNCFKDIEKGAIYFIGTRGDPCSNTFENPATKSFSKKYNKGGVKITVGMLNHTNYTDMGDKNLLRNNIKDDDNLRSSAVGRVSKSGVWILGDATRHPYFLIDLGEGRSISPSYYAILDGNAGSAFRHWELHGSVDGKIFFLLRKHVNDKRQPSNLKKGTWKLQRNMIHPLRGQSHHESYLKTLTKGGTRMPYVRYFRIVKDAQGSSSSWYLGVSGFEVYGKYETMNWMQKF